MLIFKVSLHRLVGTIGCPSIGGTNMLIGGEGEGALMSDVIQERPFTIFGKFDIAKD